MRILDKYILKEFLGPFLFGVAAFTAIFLGADTLLKIADYVTKYGASSTAALKIFIFISALSRSFRFSMIRCKKVTRIKLPTTSSVSFS